MNSSIFKLKMLGLNNSVNANRTEHILNSMAKGGIEIAPNGCHGGGCGVCKIKILKGDVETSHMSEKHISPTEREQDYVLACRAYPKTDIEFEFIGKVKCKKTEDKKFGLV